MVKSYSYSLVKRDFSDEARAQLIQAIKEVNESQWCEVTDYIGDSIQRIMDNMSSEEDEICIDVNGELLNASEYYKKIVDKNNTTEKEINQIFDDVIKEDKKGKMRLKEAYECIQKQTAYIRKLADMINPNNCKFQAEQIAKELEGFYHSMLEKAGAVMDNVWEKRFESDEYSLAGELLFALAGEESIKYCDYEDMTEAERQQYMGVVANMLKELAPYLALGAEFPRIEIPIGGDAYIYYELKTSKEFKESEKENYAGLQLMLSNQLESIASYTLHTSNGSIEIGADRVTVEGKQGAGSVKNIFGIGTDGSLHMGMTFDYDAGSVNVKKGMKFAEKEVYIEAESETEQLGTVTTTIGMGQKEDDLPDEVPKWSSDNVRYLEEKKSFMDNPLDYLMLFPGNAPAPFFW